MAKPKDMRPISIAQIKYLTELRQQINLCLGGIVDLSMREAKREIERLIRSKQAQNRRKKKKTIFNTPSS